MRASLVTLLVVASCGSSAVPVPDQRTPDLTSVDMPSLLWNDVTPLPRCEGGDGGTGTPILHCSSQKPYFCNASLRLEHKCSTCGCPGNGVCDTTTEACQTIRLKLNPSADSYVSEAAPTENHGTAGNLIVGWNSKVLEAYLDFDLSSIPAKATIVQATLTFGLALAICNNPKGILKATLVVDPWSEQAITFNTAPVSVTAPEAKGTFSINSMGIAQLDGSLDLQPLVQKWVDSPTLLHGFRISPVSMESWSLCSYMQFGSRESGAKPMLEIVYR